MAQENLSKAPDVVVITYVSLTCYNLYNRDIVCSFVSSRSVTLAEWNHGNGSNDFSFGVVINAYLHRMCRWQNANSFIIIQLSK